MMKTKNKSVSLLITLLVASALTACSSGSKKEEPNLDFDDSAPAAKSGSSAKSSKGESSPGVLAKDMPPEMRYKALGEAVRGGNQQGITDEAGRILGSNPHDPVALNTLALVQLRRGKPGAAKLLLDRAFEKNAPTATMHNNLGVILLADGDKLAAQNEFKKALRLDSGHAEALGNLGSLYANGGDFQKALPLLEQSYRKNRSQAAIANNYAVALRHNKDNDGAARIYEAIIKQNPKDVNALLNYAILLIEFANKPKDGMDVLYKLKFLDTDRKEVLSRANALEKKAKSDLKLQ